MGRGIAHVSALAGYDVGLTDANPDALEVARAEIDRNLSGGVKRGKLTEEQRERALDRLHLCTTLSEAISQADVVVEAIVENLEAKRALLIDVEAQTTDAILASNTSSLPLRQIAEPLEHPERLVGMHFFNPVHIMSLVEIVVHDATAAETERAAVNIVRKLSKEPIVVRDSPGFASSRLGVILGLEAMRMVEQEVASAEDIDKAMTLGYKHPMGAAQTHGPGRSRRSACCCRNASPRTKGRSVRTPRNSAQEGQGRPFRKESRTRVLRVAFGVTRKI